MLLFQPIEFAHLLLVDDLQDNLTVLKGHLRTPANYRISTALSGKEAITKAIEETIDLILLDIAMPDMDGFQTCAELKKNPATAQIPIIFITAGANKDHCITCFELGAADYVEKPINPPVLQARIRTHLILYKNHLELTAKQKQVEYELYQSEAKYQFLVENQTDFVIKLNKSGQFLFVSPSFCEKIGKTETSLIGTAFIDLLDSSAQQIAADCHQHLAKTETDIFVVQMKLLQTTEWIAWSSKAILDNNGYMNEIVTVGRIVTAQKQAEERARQTLESLSHFGRLSALGEMSTTIAHEINQPLTVILGCAQALQWMLQQVPMNLADISLAANKIVKNAGLTNEIIKRIRSFACKQPLQKKFISLNLLVKEMTQLIDYDLGRYKIDLTLDLADSLMDVWGDEVHIQQVVLNLLRNSINAIHKNDGGERKIILQTCPFDKDFAAFRIHDSGGGIAPELQPYLFEPFKSSKEGSLGIGLSIARSLIEEHQGALMLEAPLLPLGTTFCFTLPYFCQN